jgi:hypothetical protein
VFFADLQTKWNKRTLHQDKRRKSLDKKVISFHSLGPGDAHNQCDASIAHVKRALRKDLSVCSLMETVNHLAYSYSRFSKKNFHLIEVFHENFKKYMKLLTPVPFISKSYDIYYKDPVLEIVKCSCNCKKKCKHKCCNDREKKKVYYLDCVDRKDKEETFKIIVEDENIERDPDEIESLEETDFYKHSQTRSRNLQKKNEIRSDRTINLAYIDEEDDSDEYIDY